MNDELTWWSGEGGDAYMLRNDPSEQNIAARTQSLNRVLARCYLPIQSVLEVGAGPGANLRALHVLLPQSQLYTVEPNETVRKRLESLSYVKVFDGHAGAICAEDNSFDLVLTAGVLIHVNPDRLSDCMREIVRVSRRYVLAIEYFAPKCEPIVYYGAERIWRNNFGKLYRDECGLKPIAHGFFWKEGGEGYDNTVWHLLEKP